MGCGAFVPAELSAPPIVLGRLCLCVCGTECSTHRRHRHAFMFCRTECSTHRRHCHCFRVCGTERLIHCRRCCFHDCRTGLPSQLVWPEIDSGTSLLVMPATQIPAACGTTN